MKKSSPLVLIIPLLIALVIVGSVIVVRYFSPVPEESQAAPPAVPSTIPLLHVPSGKPEVGFDKMQSTTPVSELRQSFEGASDSGTSDLDALEEDAAAL